MILHRRIYSLLLLLAVSLSQTARALEPEEIWEKASGSVVYLQINYSNGKSYEGTGFACEVDGKTYIMSNRHVIGTARTVRFGITTNNLVTAPTYMTSPEVDLALIEIPPGFKITPLIKRQGPVRPGERIHVIGYPLGLRKTITQGIINSLEPRMITFDAPISSGSSGSPILDKDGLVVGVVEGISYSGYNVLAQKVNLGVDIRVLPELRPFRKAAVGLFDAWRELALIESDLVKGLDEIKVLEIHRYLNNHWLIAMGLRSAQEAQAEQEQLFNEIIASHQSLDVAVTRATRHLQNEAKILATIPELFHNLPADEVMAEFLKDDRSIAPHIFDLKAEEITPLLTTSMEHALARYEDTLYQINYLYLRLSPLKRKHPDLIALYKRLEPNQPDSRSKPRLDYLQLTGDDSEEGQMMLFLKSRTQLPFRVKLIKGVRVPTPVQEAVADHGGFEMDLLDMFGRMADEQLQMGNLRKARAYLDNESRHRIMFDWKRHGRFAAIAGDHQTATAHFKEGVLSSYRETNPFALLWRPGKLIRSSIYETMIHPRDEDAALPEKFRNSLEKYRTHVAEKGWASHIKSVNGHTFLASKEFSLLDEFDQMGLVWLVWENTTSTADQNKMTEALTKAPAALSAFQRLHIK